MQTTPEFPTRSFRLSDAAVIARQSFVIVFAALGMLAGGYFLVTPANDTSQDSFEHVPATIEPARD